MVIDTNRTNEISNFVTSLVAAPKSYGGRTQKDSSHGDNSQKTGSDKHNSPEFGGKNRPGCYDATRDSQRNHAKYCGNDCRNAVDRAKDRQRKSIARSSKYRFPVSNYGSCEIPSLSFLHHTRSDIHDRKTDFGSRPRPPGSSPKPSDSETSGTGGRKRNQAPRVKSYRDCPKRTSAIDRH